ncbi:MAG: DUF29 domain-containing protein [Acidobacteriaceae bacterium]|nr:DUF29 domain-containing protein [Acidobacteriota bacterium]MBV9498508.1 DUF29 domain-containing protein [Acidobacteriaceae bacterium]
MFTIEEDFHGWLLDQAAALRARDYEALDWDRLAEEVELMGARERRELNERLKNLLWHLLKFKYQPTQIQRHRSWRSSVREAREQIEDILADSPGIFGGRRDKVLAVAYTRARQKAADQSGQPLAIFPEECPWTYEQVVDEDFFPGVTKN